MDLLQQKVRVIFANEHYETKKKNHCQSFVDVSMVTVLLSEPAEGKIIFTPNVKTQDYFKPMSAKRICGGILFMQYHP